MLHAILYEVYPILTIYIYICVIFYYVTIYYSTTVLMFLKKTRLLHRISTTLFPFFSFSNQESSAPSLLFFLSHLTCPFLFLQSRV